MSEHSPTPWTQVKLHPEQILAAGQLARDGFQIVADPFFAHNYPASAKRMCEANAELITRAVNSHQMLVEALEECITILDGAQSGFFPGSGSDLAWQEGRDRRIADARMALAYAAPPVESKSEVVG